MRKCFKPLAVVALFVAAVSCNSKPEALKGFEQVETGAYMKFYERSHSTVSPRIGDGVTFVMAQYFDDSLLFTTADSEPLDIRLEPAPFVGDITDALLFMHIGDSARIAILADSVFTSMGGMEVPEEYAGKYIQYDVKLLSIKPKEEIEAELKHIADSLKTEGNRFLEQMRNTPGCEVLESGLMVMGKPGKGKVAQKGDYVDFDFLMLSKEGDTLLSSFDVESVLMQYGEDFVCDGFVQALGMTPQGCMARFVVPSELGFDSVGYQDILFPYEPFVLQLRMNEVMDLAGYNRKNEARERKVQEENERRMTLEDARIKAYLKSQHIDAEATETGLYLVREAEGTGSVAQWGDAVAVHYTMGNLNGEQVESSYEIGEPMRFTIGRGEMLPCIEEAVMTMSPGARVLLVSPSDLGFGEFSVHETLLPAYSPLVIELELVSIE